MVRVPPLRANMRNWCNGSTPAFQAGSAGSMPVFRSRPGRSTRPPICAARKAQAARLLTQLYGGARTNTGPSIQRLAQPHEAGIGINIVYFCIKNSDDFKGASFVEGDGGLWLGILWIRFCVRYICREVSSNRADSGAEPWFRYNARSESRAVSVA